MRFNSKGLPVSTLVCLFSALWVICGVLLGAPVEAPVAAGSQDPEVRALQQRLLDDQAGLSLAEKQLAKLKAERDDLLEHFDLKSIDAAALSRSEVAVSTAKLAYENAKIELDSIRQTEAALEHAIHDLDFQLKARVLNRTSSRNKQQSDSNDAGVTELSNKLQAKRAAAALIKNRTVVLKATAAIDDEILSVEESWYQKIKNLREIQVATYREAKQQELEGRLKQDEDTWQKKASFLKQQLAGGTRNKTEAEKLKAQIFEAEEKSALTNVNLNLVRQQARMFELNIRLGNAEGNPQILRNLIDSWSRMQEELSKSEKLIRDKVEVLMGWRNLYQKRKDSKSIDVQDYKQKTDLVDELLVGYQTEQKLIEDLLKNLKKNVAKSKAAYSQGLSVRQTLPATGVAWWNLLQVFAQLPKMVWQSMILLTNRAEELFTDSGQWFLGTLIIGFMGVAGSVWGQIKLGQIVSHYAHHARRSPRFVSRAFWFVSALLRRNLILYVTALEFFLFVWVWDISFAAYGVLGSILVILLLFKTLLDINRLLLFERMTDESGQDVRLYQALKWALLLGGALTILSALAHLLNLPIDEVAFIDRLFMLFLLAVSYVLIRNQHVLNELIPAFETRPRYVQHTFRLFGILFPLAILSNALIGLIGYVNLAWRMGVAEGQFLLVLALWMLLRGLLNDLMASVYEYFIRYVQNGWLWTESVLKPLQRLLNIGLLMLGVGSLCWLYGWGKDSAVFDVIQTVLFYPLIHVSENPITVFSLLQFFLVASIFFWASKWSREFSYRWLFSGVKDLGLRNSFSIFIQYAVIAVGFYMVLIVLGIDVTTLAVAGGALLVGIGFGLQNIANNLMSGVLLLLERPVRTGDVVSIGSYEGEVTRIGIRSMTVKTWDHFEVIIPNAETVGHSFMNWTHRDNIVRTVFPMRVDVNDDPHLVRELIESVLRKNSRILPNPAPEVLLIEFGDSHLLFQVRYFIDLGLEPSRPRVQSAVMFEIWDVFKAHSIRFAYPHRHITGNWVDPHAS